jgi:hypothetical protein
MLKVFAINNNVQITVTGENLIEHGDVTTVGTVTGKTHGKLFSISTEDAINLRDILTSMDLDNYHTDKAELSANELLAENLIRSAMVDKGIDVDLAPGMGILPLCFKCAKEPDCPNPYGNECPMKTIYRINQ